MVPNQSYGQQVNSFGALIKIKVVVTLFKAFACKDRLKTVIQQKFYQIIIFYHHLRNSVVKKESAPDNQQSDDSDNSSSDVDNSKLNILKFLPPANPLQPRVYKYDYEIKTAFELQLESLPDFHKDKNYVFVDPIDKLENQLSSFRKDEVPLQLKKDKNALNNDQEQKAEVDDKLMLRQMNLFEYHKENKDKLVYKRYYDYNLDNPTQINGTVYFATYLAKLKKIINGQRTGYTQYLKNSDYNSSTNGSTIGSEEKQKRQDSPQKQQWQHTLIFSSRFESGNLFCAYQIGESEYDLILQHDINTKGNTQWFFFSTKNTRKGQTVKFNIINLIKDGSLFNDGLCPVVYSCKENQLRGTEWQRDGFNVKYFKNYLTRDGQRYKNLFTITFSYTFVYDNDTMYFAHSYPYTYSQLMDYLNKIMMDKEKNEHISRKILCKSLLGNNCDMLTITSNQIKRRNFRKGIVFLARQHPGETGGSYIMHGIIEFLTGKSPEAIYLKENCVFKIVPMTNPDGVIHGNYRCSLAGCDLNRRWKKPKRRLHPTVYFIKEMIKNFSREKEIKLIVDLHGHSRKMHAFFYGCSYKEDPVQPRIYPYMVSKQNSQIAFSECRFNIHRSKESTARVMLWKELRIHNIFTFEASFYGYQNKVLKKNYHFTIQDYLKLGHDLCLNLYQILKDEEERRNQSQDIQGGFNVASGTKTSSLLDELKNQKFEDDQEEDSVGSDSNPSEDELKDEELVHILPKKVLSKKQKSLIQQMEEDERKRLEALKKQPKVEPPPEPKEVKKVLPQIKPKFNIVKKEPLKTTPEMVDKCIQTDASFLQEYRAHLMQKRLNRLSEKLDITKELIPLNQQQGTIKSQINQKLNPVNNNNDIIMQSLHNNIKGGNQPLTPFSFHKRSSKNLDYQIISSGQQQHLQSLNIQQGINGNSNINNNNISPYGGGGSGSMGGSGGEQQQALAPLQLQDNINNNQETQNLDQQKGTAANQQHDQEMMQMVMTDESPRKLLSLEQRMNQQFNQNTSQLTLAEEGSKMLSSQEQLTNILKTNDRYRESNADVLTGRQDDKKSDHSPFSNSLNQEGFRNMKSFRIKTNRESDNQFLRQSAISSLNGLNSIGGGNSRKDESPQQQFISEGMTQGKKLIIKLENAKTNENIRIARINEPTKVMQTSQFVKQMGVSADKKPTTPLGKSQRNSTIDPSSLAEENPKSIMHVSNKIKQGLQTPKTREIILTNMKNKSQSYTVIKNKQSINSQNIVNNNNNFGKKI